MHLINNRMKIAFAFLASLVTTERKSTLRAKHRAKETVLSAKEAWRAYSYYRAAVEKERLIDLAQA